MKQTPPTTELDLAGSLATFGQVVGILVLIILLIFACAWVFKRISQSTSLGSSQVVKLVSVTSLSPKERLVVVEVDERWLVLGVTANTITKLDELEKKSLPTRDASTSFSSRLHNAVKQFSNSSSKG